MFGLNIFYFPIGQQYKDYIKSSWDKTGKKPMYDTLYYVIHFYNTK